VVNDPKEKSIFQLAKVIHVWRELIFDNSWGVYEFRQHTKNVKGGMKE